MKKIKMLVVTGSFVLTASIKPVVAQQDSLPAKRIGTSINKAGDGTATEPMQKVYKNKEMQHSGQSDNKDLKVVQNSSGVRKPQEDSSRVSHQTYPLDPVHPAKPVAPAKSLQPIKSATPIKSTPAKTNKSKTIYLVPDSTLKNDTQK